MILSHVMTRPLTLEHTAHVPNKATKGIAQQSANVSMGGDMCQTNNKVDNGDRVATEALVRKKDLQSFHMV